MAQQLLYRNSDIKVYVDRSLIVVSWLVDGCWIIKKFLQYTPEIAAELIEWLHHQ